MRPCIRAAGCGEDALVERLQRAGLQGAGAAGWAGWDLGRGACGEECAGVRVERGVTGRMGRGDFEEGG